MIYRSIIFLTLCFCVLASQSRAIFAEATPTQPANSAANSDEIANASPGAGDPPLATGATDVDAASNLSPSEKATIEDMLKESRGEPQRSPAVVDSN